MATYTTNFHLDPEDNQRLANLSGQYDKHIQQLEKSLNVSIRHRGHHFQISGDTIQVHKAEDVIKALYQLTASQQAITPEVVHIHLHEDAVPITDSLESRKPIVFHTKIGDIQGRTVNQRRYLENIVDYDINFGIGPAGTGKTYLAVAAAVDALEHGKVQRVVLVRPAVEAGEKLGFLPGTLVDKIDPYLRPLYDALFEMIGFEKVSRLIEQNVIEIAPLAYMRGRTLNESFIILDEAQNTTIEQMKMFLTRIGFSSKAVITGDITQTDLPKPKRSGLIDAMQILKNIDEICFTFFDSKDVVRHALVQRIIEAYAAHEAKLKSDKESSLDEE